MALGDDLKALADGYSDAEIGFVLDAQNDANAAQSPSLGAAERAGLLAAAIMGLGDAVKSARRIAGLTQTAQTASPSGYLSALQVLYQNPRYKPSECAIRVSVYEGQIVKWENQRRALLGMPELPPPPGRAPAPFDLNDLLGRAPAPPGGVDLWGLALGGAAVVAAWFLLFRGRR